MKAVYFENTNKSNIETLTFTGYDNSNDAAANSLYDTYNMCSDEYPRIATRKPRETVDTYTNPQALFSSIKLCVVADNKFYYDGVEKGTVSDGDKSIVEMHNNIVIFPDLKYYNHEDDEFRTFDGLDVDYACLWNNRIWGVKDQTIMASKLGEFDDWETYDNLDNDSYAVDVAGNESFCGIITYQNHVTMFMPNRIFEMYGTKPSNFQYSESSIVGSTNHKSIVEVESILFSLHHTGVKAYLGGFPRDLSSNINQSFVSAVSGSDKFNLYMNIYDGSEYKLFVYNPIKQVWYKEDSGQIIDFAFYDESLYALYADGKLVKFDGDNNDYIRWSFETQEFDYYNDNKTKYINTIILTVSRLKGVGNVFVKFDGNEYVNVGMLKESETSENIPVPIRSCDKFRIKLEGYGEVVVKEMHKKIVWGD